MIRIASKEDTEIVSRMALEFIRMTAYALFLDEGRVVRVVKDFLSKPASEGVVLLDSEGRGVLAGIKTPCLFNDGFVATELAWWVDPEHRKAGIGAELLDTFEYWAKKVGCDFVTMVSLDDELCKFYEDEGYLLYERAYMKKL